MAASKRNITALSCAVFALVLGLRLKPILDRTTEVYGVWRNVNSTVIAGGDDDLVYIPDTIQCEDLHYHTTSGLIFTACQDDAHSRLSWFPPLSNFDDPLQARNMQGSIHVINPETFTSTRLDMENFSGPFITHGIDIITDPEDSGSVYIFAVNHAPHPEYLRHIATDKPSKHIIKSQSVIELFHHTLHSTSTRHIRTIQHPLITTPNDVFALSPTSFFVTNDHYYREGHLRAVEDLYLNARWTNTIHVAITDIAPASKAPQDGITVSVALANTHNNNGLGHGRTADEILISDCTGGELLIGQISANNQIRVVDSIQSHAVVDNPSYFADPYGNRDGFLLPGLTKGLEFGGQIRDPKHKIPAAVVFASIGADTAANATSPMTMSKPNTQWTTRTLFEDDGSRLSTASAAVLVPIPPAKSAGDARQAWLFVTGFLSHSTIALKVNL